jgi:2-polyprenyl-6-methoxyphenol hydroxylase-like FAD-dependent oxidoreductase
MFKVPILIVGAGPTGLVLALRLAHHGVQFRIIDKKSGPGQASRAMVVQARTLEFYGQLGLADAVIERGIKVESAHFIEHGHEVAAISWHGAGAKVTPYPFVLTFPQDDHERFLVDELAALGVTVEWDTSLQSFEQDENSVTAVIRTIFGEEICSVDYLCGCDGAHTAVRPSLRIGFPGDTYSQQFYVADISVTNSSASGFYMHLGERTLVMLPVRSTGMQRVIGVVPAGFGEPSGLTFDDIRPVVEGSLGIDVAAVNWFTTYRVHHRVAERFRVGRVFIAGDAGHLHSPAGGQGMNTGIGDAVNLSWKLANVIQGRVGDQILDTFETERIGFARKLVETTDRAFQGMVSEGWTSQILRSWILPHIAPALSGLSAVRRAMFAMVSQTRIGYRKSALSKGQAGTVFGGDRLPWAGSNYASLKCLDWRLHVYGELTDHLSHAAAAIGVVVDVFPWDENAKHSGFGANAAYLIRPDGHVALAMSEQSPEGLSSYAASIGLVPQAVGSNVSNATMVA